MKLLALPLALSLGLALLACGPNSDDGGGDDVPPPDATLVVTPAHAMLEVVNRAPVTQDYTATLVHDDGGTEDVTDRVTFVVATSGYGTFSGRTLTVNGSAAGLTEVRAVLGDLIGTAPLTVRVRGVRIDPGAPANAPDLFTAATEAAGQAPSVVYPDDHVLVPPNLGELDVHWRDTASNNLFEIVLKNEFVDLRVYQTGAQPWMVYVPDEWSPLASSRQPLELTVAGLRTASPATKGTSPRRTVDVTNEDARGGIYYWATNGSGILRYDVETPNVRPEPLFPAGIPTGCVGCHALSRDGNKIAITFDSGDGRGGIMDLTTNTFLFPYERGIRWNFATFNPSGSELIALKDGQMRIYDVTTGNQITQVPGVTSATHPELSPDGTTLAYVESSGRPDYYVNNGGVVVRDYTEATHTFGAPRMLVPYVAGQASYYPSWSPDGKWLAITRNNGLSYDNGTSTVWVVKADGTLPPLQLTAANAGANLTNSWARWVPFAQSAGPGNEEVFYLTFSTKRPFGTRRPSAGTPQIWMAPFFPGHAVAGADPSGPAFRLPFQALQDNNHIAQWTERVVIP